MSTTRTISTLMLTASLAAGILMPEGAFAGNGDRHDQIRNHNDRQRTQNKSDRGADHKTKRFGESKNKNEGKKKQEGTVQGAGTKTSSQGGNPPKNPAPTPPKQNSGTGNGLPAGTAVVSNGRIKMYIPNSASGLTVTKNKSGTITVSNGDPTRSVTLPGGSVTIAGGGVTNVGASSGVQVIRQSNGGFTAAANLPPTAPPKKTSSPGTVTGGPKGGFFPALGNGIVDIFRVDFERKVTPENVVPPPKTSTSVQQ